MKKILMLLLVFMLAFACVACGDEPENPQTPSEPTEPTPTPEPTLYTVKWYDENGELITSSSVEEGKTPSVSYTVTDTVEWDYTLDGWATTEGGAVLEAIPAASADASYYAVVSAQKQKYTVSFNTQGGSEVEAQTVEYGAKAQKPADPTYDGHIFMGWAVSAEANAAAADFEATVTGDVEYFAVWNEYVDVKALLKKLLEGYELNPYSYIPETMRIDYSENLVNADDVITDYSSFVNVSDITYGFGEQWHMILDNLNQSATFFNVLSVVESISATTLAAFNNYFDQNPADTAHHEFESGIYNVTVSFDGNVIYYVLDYTADLPVFGNQTVQIALSMNAETYEKDVRVQIGDANALHYTMGESFYTFAIRYLGVRRAMFTLERDADGNVEGHINEFLTVSSAEIASAADFYITDEYLSCVGNKADGLLGFTSYITELYSVESGELLGYEVEEVQSSIQYNTLWFDLKDISGITSIKYREKTDTAAAAMFINGSSSAWANKKVGGVGTKMFSRRFDIEMRTQFVYSYDAATEKYTQHKIQVPMIFVQEENYDSFISDVKATNNVTISVGVSDSDLTKLMADYDTLIPKFITNKDTVTVDKILEFIGEKVTFE